MHVEIQKKKTPLDSEKMFDEAMDEKDSSFFVHYIPKGEEFVLDKQPRNRILYVIKGNLLLNETESETKILRRKHMYFLHQGETPMKTIAIEHVIALEYVSDLLSLINQQSLYKLVLKHAFKPQNIEELEIQKPLMNILNSVIFLKKQNLQSKFLFDIKKEEFFFFFKRLYSEEEIARFFSPFLKEKGKFSAIIYMKYTSGETVNSLADKCCMTTKTLTRHFKKEFNITPYKWLAEQKAKEIEQYLIHHSPITISELMKKFNFSSTKALILFCKMHHIGCQDRTVLE